MAGKVLIVDDVATNRIVLKVKLASACYATFQAASGAEALTLAAEVRPDLILLDVQLPDMDGIEVCRRLKADPLTRTIPVVMVTAFRDHAAKMRALRAGAEDFLSKPLDELVLLARLRSLLRARETEDELHLRETTCRELGFAEAKSGFELPGAVALVAGQRDRALGWKQGLSGHLADRIMVLDRDGVLADAGNNAVPDVFVIAADLARRGDGLRLMSELRSRAATRHSAICIVVNPEDRETGAVALDLGANDLIAEAFDPQEMALRIRTQLTRKRQADRLRSSVEDGLRMAVTDPLTGLYNRRYALPHLSRIAERAQDTGRPFAVMVLDLDRFKAVNDQWGHAAGDAVLIEVADRLRQNLRGVDLVARMGGEEFLIAMPDTTLDAARITAERICRVVETVPVLPRGSERSIPVTVSIGLAMGTGADTRPQGIEDLIARADHALLGSKAEGRNQVTISLSSAA